MTQYTLIQKYKTEGLNAIEIYTRLKEIFEPENLSYSTVTYHLRKESFTPINEDTRNFGGRPPNYRIDALILKELEKNPSQGYRMIAESIGYDPSSVYYVLTHRLGFRAYNLQWVPHELNTAQKMLRVQMSKTLLTELEIAEKNNWHFILTGDESWFYYSTKNRIMWLPKGSKSEKIPRFDINAPKVMVTIFWNPDGAWIIDALQPGQQMNADYFIEHILMPIVHLPQVKDAQMQKQKFIIHMDNLPIKYEKVTQKFLVDNHLFMPNHPPYSPDIAPSDFYLFGKLKKKLKGQEFPDTESLIAFINEEFRGIPGEELKAVFKAWVKRLKEVVDTNGDYVT